MSAANLHRIGRQVLELELAAMAGAADLQEQAASSFRQGSAELGELFDRLAGPEELVRIERLEIDLGELRGLDWRDQLHDRLLERLRESLARRDRRPAGRAAAEPTRPAPADMLFEQFLFFLANGRLPWWGPRPAASWSEAPPEPRNEAQRRALAELLRADDRALRRLVLTVNEDYLASRVAELAGIEHCQEVIRELIPAALDKAQRRRWRWRFWRETLALATAEGAAEEPGTALMRRLLAPLDRARPDAGGSPTVEPELPRAGTARKAPEVRLPQPWRRWLERALADPATAITVERAAAGPEVAPAAGLAPSGLPAADRGEAGTGRSTGRTPEAPAIAGPRPPDAVERAARPPGDRPPGDPSRAPSQGAPAPPAEPGTRPELPVAVPRSVAEPLPPVAQTEAVHIGGAGIVILHPFLEELFGARDLIVERRFRDEEARARAVHLLGHLAFGVERPEHELLLPKLLCAMSWEEPLAPVELDDDDRAACAELLTAVLGHWRALKSASVDWLREQFFLRDGRLELVDDGWKLTVESHAQDVLLSRLPWGLGLIRLPWARELLHVSWFE